MPFLSDMPMTLLRLKCSKCNEFYDFESETGDYHEIRRKVKLAGWRMRFTSGDKPRAFYTCGNCWKEAHG